MNEAAPEGGEKAAGGEEGENRGKGGGGSGKSDLWNYWARLRGGRCGRPLLLRSGQDSCCGLLRMLRDIKPFLGDLLLDQKEAKNDIESDHTECQIEHSVVSCLGINNAAQEWSNKVSEAHSQKDVAHDHSYIFLSHGVNE